MNYLRDKRRALLGDFSQQEKINLWTATMNNGVLNSSNGAFQNSTTRIANKKPILLEAGTYILSNEINNDFIVQLYSAFDMNTDGTATYQFTRDTASPPTWLTSPYEFTISEPRYIRISVRDTSNTDLKIELFKK